MADITIISTKTTCILTSAPTTNYGSEVYLSLGNSGGLIYVLIEFDLATCPQVKTAILHIQPYGGAGAGANGTIERVTASWVESTVTWATQPASTGNYGTYTYNGFGDKTVDITTLVNEWKVGTYANYGLKIITTAADGNYVNFRSDDYATEGERPRIVITPAPSGGILNWFFSEAWRKHDRLWTPKLLLPKEGYSY